MGASPLTRRARTTHLSKPVPATAYLRRSAGQAEVGKGCAKRKVSWSKRSLFQSIAGEPVKSGVLTIIFMVGSAVALDMDDVDVERGELRLRGPSSGTLTTVARARI